ncbi:MAG: GGDEF domain-containing protein [Steroidobacteraceae bacterium]|nr:GGDEF domain-containing protein [Deltaproteobacteria bacterium]
MRFLTDVVQNLGTSDSPERFKKTYLLLVFSSLILILALSFTVISQQNRNNLIDDAEFHSEKIALALLSSESNFIHTRTRDGADTLSIDPADIASLDLNIRLFLHPFNIVKIKIYNSEKRIIYSTEQALIGKSDRGNLRLGNALGGMRQSVIKNRQSITDLSDERRMEVDVAEVYVPVRNERGQVVGVFELYSDIGDLKNSFRDHLVYSLATIFIALLLLSLTSYVVIVRESDALSTAYQLLETLATVDSLTGIYNRRQLLIRAAELYSMMQRSREKLPDGVGLGVIMIDVDFFKLVNDTHGHLVGDNILNDLTRRIETVLRPYDVFGRYGGEEFLLFLPNTSCEEAKQISCRILNTVSCEPYQVGELSLRVTTSIGCTWTDAHEENLDHVLSRVDNLLYEAKRSGRNQVVCRF